MIRNHSEFIVPLDITQYNNPLSLQMNVCPRTPIYIDTIFDLNQTFVTSSQSVQTCKNASYIIQSNDRNRQYTKAVNDGHSYYDLLLSMCAVHIKFSNEESSKPPAKRILNNDSRVIVVRIQLDISFLSLTPQKMAPECNQPNPQGKSF